MICDFCKQDIENPCRQTQDVERRAERHVERCEKALDGAKADRDQQG